MRDMPTTEVFKTAKWNSLHFMYKVKLATLAYKIFHDCTPPSMGHILTKKTSSIHHLRTSNTVTVPRFNTYFMKNSIAFRASIAWNLLTPVSQTHPMSRTIQEWPPNRTNYVT